jgi:hypothetical protein
MSGSTKGLCEEVDVGKLFISIWVFTGIALYLMVNKLYDVAIIMATLGIGMALYFRVCSGRHNAKSSGFSRSLRGTDIISIVLNLINITLSIVEKLGW